MGKIDIVKNGDMGDMGAMLASQAHSLDAIFQNLALRSKNQEYIKPFEKHKKLALRFQNQCRVSYFVTGYGPRWFRRSLERVGEESDLGGDGTI